MNEKLLVPDIKKYLYKYLKKRKLYTTWNIQLLFDMLYCIVPLSGGFIQERLLVTMVCHGLSSH